MFNPSSAIRIKYLLEKTMCSSGSHSLPPLPWICTTPEVCSFIECWACSSHLFAAALGIFIPYQFYCNRYHWLIFGPCFHKTAYAFPSTRLGESLLRGDSSEKIWNASISASGFKDTRLRSQLSDLKNGGLAGGALWLCSCCLCAAYQGGGVESHAGDQSRRAPAGQRDIRIGKSFRGLREGCVVRGPVTPPTLLEMKGVREQF